MRSRDLITLLLCLGLFAGAVGCGPTQTKSVTPNTTAAPLPEAPQSTSSVAEVP